MSCSFSPKNLMKGFTVGHLNTRSIRNKCDSVYALLIRFNISILSVNETWLDSSIPTASLTFPGYSVFRVDRSTRGGEVAKISKFTD